jgi:hypothetical protein
MKKLKWWDWLLIVLAATLLLNGLAKLTGTTGPTRTICQKEAAFFEAHEHVKSRLVAPATADFASYWDSAVVAEADSAVRIRSYVDAQNGFGANVRTTYWARLRCTPEGWALVSLETQP